MTLPKVLVATCTYSGKHYAFKKWWEAISKLNYGMKDYLIVDNSKDNGNYARKLRMLTQGRAKVVHVKRLKNSRDTLSYSQNWIRQYIMNNDYDFWLSVESDIEIPHIDLIQRLMSWQKPVVGGLYEIGFTNKNGRRFCVFLPAQKKEGINGTRLINQKEQEHLLKLNNGLIQVHGCGIGCTLIRREIIEKYPFWTDERFDNKHSDVYFYMDLHNAQVPVYVDTSVKCEHHNSDWSLVGDR